MAGALDPRTALERLGRLLALQRRARAADTTELLFVMANETRQLVPYRQAAVFSLKRGRPALEAASGLAVPEPNAPYAQWLARFVAFRLDRPNPMALDRIDFAAAPAEGEPPAPSWYGEWTEWLPRHLLWAPLPDGRGGLCGVLLLARDAPFTDPECTLAAHLAEAYGAAWALSVSRPGKGWVRRRWLSPLTVAVACLAVAAGLWPVRQSVLAPAEVAARRPALVRAGLDGVIDRFLVEPNQRVEAGDPLIRLEDAQLRTRLAVARKAGDMAQAEYRQLLQAALSDPAAKQRIPVALGRIDQLAAETAYIESLLERVVIASPMRGVALCDDPDEWLGRPVSLGQRIMLVADPEDVELEIAMPAGESVRVEEGDPVVFFPNVAPVSSMRGAVRFVGYRAAESPGVGMAYVLRADLDAPSDGAPLLGLRGMAKLYGPRQPLALHLFRKPLLAARQWLGL